jgi:membrane protein implicated in regulation of membrane protease activity
MSADVGAAERPDLSRLLAARRAWLRRHATVGVGCAAAVALLAVLLLVGIRNGFAAGHPGATVLDAALMGVLASLAAGSTANAWAAWRFASRIDVDAVATGCQVRRLAPETRMRKDYLQVTVGETTVLVRCAEDAPTSSMAETIQGRVLGWPANRGGVVLLLPHLDPIAATVGRYHRQLPRALRAEFSADRAPAAD